MGNVKVRYLVERQRKRRSTRFYWIPTAKLQAAGFLPRRLSDDKVTAIAEAESHNAALDRWYMGETPQSKGPVPGSLAALDELFQTDQAFRGTRDRTQRDYLYGIKPALAWAADEQVAHLTRRAIKAWYRDQLATRGVANARNAMAALRRLLSFGLDEGWISEHPALKLRVKAPASRGRTWAQEEREGFCRAAVAKGRPSMALAVEIGRCLGQRPTDLRKLPWTAYDPAVVTRDRVGRTILIGAVQLRQEKTGRLVWVPCLPELKAALDGAPRLSTQMVVSENTGRPYQESDFQHTFAEIRAYAGLPADLQYRDLRRTFLTDLGRAGCTDDQLRSVSGHTTRNVVSVYVQPDTTFAERAMVRLQEARTGIGVERVQRKRSTVGAKRSG